MVGLRAKFPTPLRPNPLLRRGGELFSWQRRIPAFVEACKYRDPSSPKAPQDDMLGGVFRSLLVSN